MEQTNFFWTVGKWVTLNTIIILNLHKASLLFFNKLVGLSICSYVTGLNENKFYPSFIWNLILTMLWWSLYLSSISGIVRSFVSIFVVSIYLVLLRKYLFITRNSCFLRYYFIVYAVYHIVKKSAFVKKSTLLVPKHFTINHLRYVESWRYTKCRYKEQLFIRS